MSYKVYKIVNLINGKSYIGLTKNDIRKRFSEHKYNAKKRKNLPLYNAINKHGLENFTVLILEDNLTKKEAAEQEIFYIKKINTLNPNGYNISSGGESGRSGVGSWCKGLTKENNEVVARIAEKQLGENNSFFGKTHSDKNKENWSKTRRGENHGMFGVRRPELALKNSQKQWTDEERQKIKIANSKPILCIENGIIYPSIKDAALFLGTIDTKGIINVLKGRTLKTKGYSFKYMEKGK